MPTDKERIEREGHTHISILGNIFRIETPHRNTIWCVHGSWRGTLSYGTEGELVSLLIHPESGSTLFEVPGFHLSIYTLTNPQRARRVSLRGVEFQLLTTEEARSILCSWGTAAGSQLPYQP